MSRSERSLDSLPGADLVLRGIDDLAHARPTAEAALCEVARTRLRALGLSLPESADEGVAELQLYARLGARHPDRDPYVVYGAWLDQLVSFLAALAQLRESAAREEGGSLA